MHSEFFRPLRLLILGAIGLPIHQGCRAPAGGPSPPGAGSSSPSAPLATDGPGPGGLPVAPGPAASASTPVAPAASASAPPAPAPTPVTAVPPRTCHEPRAILAHDGSHSGFVRCKDGSIDRVQAVSCAPSLAPTTCTAGRGSCTTGADCKASPGGQCVQHLSLPEADRCDCVYPTCTRDADCKSDEICACGGLGAPFPDSVPSCMKATCKSGSDCPGGECALWHDSDGCHQSYGLACRTASDQCRVEERCTNRGIPEGFQGRDRLCGPPSEGKNKAWICHDYGNLMCGRPLFVAGDPRLSAVTRGPWG